jgi:hypothetical protein
MAGYDILQLGYLQFVIPITTVLVINYIHSKCYRGVALPRGPAVGSERILRSTKQSQFGQIIQPHTSTAASWPRPPRSPPSTVDQFAHTKSVQPS